MKKLIAALAVLGFSMQAHAGENKYVTIGAGMFDVVHQDYDSAEFRLEYRHSNIWKQLYPSLVGMVNTDGGVYGGIAFNYDINLCNKVTLTPFTGVGIYEHNDSKDLGGPIEFRSGLELAYELDNEDRIGVNFSHMSNASIYDHNPGVESLVLNYSIAY